MSTWTQTEAKPAFGRARRRAPMLCSLPPISVVPAAGGSAVRDGHHRVSVALARGAVTIDALVGAA